ncbi:hypothetical protein L1787_17105 [Acuticoccus sp. M5D2P5]|uniref:hypothetical protein n=1 Tax=Acuticoccus kalidii TaxID=2910977 RepID=UPI001F1895AE|nr:hypothetical protein [Acuticoccus kalidii]MCF3935119.1 hypothetical protein [Acuticoccus kalidii]
MARQMSGAVRAAALLVAGLVLVGGAPASAQIDTMQDINNIRNNTPSCRDNPQAPWIGRVAGNTQGILDQSIPVSFVGCFPDQASCERWMGPASKIITSTLTQYSCRPRN